MVAVPRLALPSAALPWGCDRGTSGGEMMSPPMMPDAALALLLRPRGACRTSPEAAPNTKDGPMEKPPNAACRAAARPLARPLPLLVVGAGVMPPSPPKPLPPPNRLFMANKEGAASAAATTPCEPATGAGATTGDVSRPPTPPPALLATGRRSSPADRAPNAGTPTGAAAGTLRCERLGFTVGVPSSAEPCTLVSRRSKPGRWDTKPPSPGGGLSLADTAAMAPDVAVRGPRVDPARRVTSAGGVRGDTSVPAGAELAVSNGAWVCSDATDAGGATATPCEKRAARGMDTAGRPCDAAAR